MTLMVDAFATPVFKLHPDQDTTAGKPRHNNTNLSILLARGGFRHGQHIAFRRDNNAPLSNLFVTMLQRTGVETESLASSTRPIDTL